VLAVPIYRWQAPLHRELCDLSSLIREYGVRENHERAPARSLVIAAKALSISWGTRASKV